jgi:hypothetical protein
LEFFRRVALKSIRPTSSLPSRTSGVAPKLGVIDGIVFLKRTLTHVLSHERRTAERNNLDGMRAAAVLDHAEEIVAEHRKVLTAKMQDL